MKNCIIFLNNEKKRNRKMSVCMSFAFTLNMASETLPKGHLNAKKQK